MIADPRASRHEVLAAVASIRHRSLRDTAHVSPQEYTLALAALARSRAWQDAGVLLDDMVSQRLAPIDADICAAAAKACGRERRWEEGLALLSTLRRLSPSGGHSDAVRALTLRAMVAHVRGSCWRQALKLWQELQMSRISPDVTLHNVVTTAYNAGHHWEAALHHFRDGWIQRLSLNEVSINSVIAACSEGHQWKWALHLIGDGAGPTSKNNSSPSKKIVSVCF